MTRLTDIVSQILDLPHDNGRHLIAIAGPPASGKSTLADRLAAELTGAGRPALVVPMDGFHLDNRILDARGLRSRKGAPETFDVDGFIALVQRLKAGGEVVYPEFDRTHDLAVAGARVIEASCDLAILEGNYLLFDERPWSDLLPMWTLSVWLEISEELVLERSIQRWLDHEHSVENAHKRAKKNDLANARRVLKSKLPASVTLNVA